MSLFVAGCTEEPKPPLRVPARAEVHSAEPVASPQKVAQCDPAPHRLCPTDEGASDPSFAAFRERMREVVRKKEEVALMALIAPEVRTDFGGGGGHKDFRRAWELPSPASRLWTELEGILAMGGAFQRAGEDRAFWAPYVYASWPESVDAFGGVAAVRPGVEILMQAEEGAQRTATVDYEILTLRSGAEEKEGWRAVRTHDGKEGWVRATDVRSPVGYRAGFSNRSGEWKLEALVAGD